MLGASVGGKNILKHNKKNWNYKIVKRLVEKKVLIFPINNQIVMKVCSTISLGFLSPSTCAGGSCCARRASRSAALTIRDHFKWRRRKNRVTEISVSGIDLPPPHRVTENGQNEPFPNISVMILGTFFWLVISRPLSWAVLITTEKVKIAITMDFRIILVITNL